FMTNDYTSICERLKQLGCRPPIAEDLKPNSRLSRNVSSKMKELRAAWSLTVDNDTKILNYYDRQTDSFFIVFLSAIPFMGNKRNWSGSSPVFELVANNKDTELEEYAKSRGNIEERTGNGYTPLMLAAAFNACDSLKMLIKLGADMNASDPNGLTALTYAVIKKSIDALKILLSTPGINLEARDCAGGTALLNAAVYGMEDACTLLAEAGANLNAADNFGGTALIRAVGSRSDKVADFLLRSGGDVNAESGTGRTPLIIATRLGNAGIVKNLLAAGADAKHQDKNGNNALMWAAKKDLPDMIALFMERKLFSDKELEAALVKAAMCGFGKSTELMIGFSDSTETAAFAALVAACMKDRVNLVDICMNNRCNINGTIYFGMTPLMIASFCGSEETAALLISVGADVNAADDDGMTALMYAAMKNQLKIIFCLLQSGADKDARNAEGKTYEDYSRKHDVRSFTQMVMDKAKARNPRQSRADDIPGGHLSFNDKFSWYMQKYFERYPQSKNSDIYRNAGLTKQVFSRILSNRDSNFRPRKSTVLSLALGLKLTLNETEDLMQSAGCTFSNKDKADMEIKSLLSEKNYDKFDWGSRIYESTGKVFFRTMMSEDEQESS
ncbi:MAG: ankyrin repeat domain-containing protein, partial [Treponema sp.]|nr:ankyrin repeat domain-containing protein [Treponema sp.]